METFFGKLYTGIKAAAVLTNTAVCAGFFVMSGPTSLPIAYAAVTSFTWIDLFMHGRNARLAAEITAETAKLGAANAKLAAETTKLTAESAKLGAENTKLAAETGKLGAETAKLGGVNDALKKHAAALQDQLAAQTELSIQAKKFIATLVSTEGALSDVKDELIASIDRTESVANTLERITAKIADERFEDIDVDGDGKITPDELAAWAAQARAPIKH